MKANWRNLGVSQIIFEDQEYEHQQQQQPQLEDEDEDLQSLYSPPLSSSSSPLQSGADAWTEATGRKPDVKIRVRGVCFSLHKDVLISKSGYFKRQLTRVTDFTLSPTLKITADTFNQVTDFCYSNHTVMTPSNVVALSIAARLLEMDGKESLYELTESYFCDVITVNNTLTCSVFRSCLSMLPESEQTALLASRCIEALLEDEEGDGAVSCADGIKMVSPEEFRVIADSMRRRYTSTHDLLYRVVDLYFLVYNGKMLEEQKTQITSCIDCSILSAALLMHAVQNPRMPLRFLVQAMLIEQLNTHRSLYSVLNNHHHHHHPRSQQPDDSPSTLGAILERDAALRQVAQLRAAVDTTSSRIKSLEKELTGMKKLVLECDKQKVGSNSILSNDDERKSSSCRFNNVSTNKVERGQRGSVSSSVLRFGGSNDLQNNNNGVGGQSQSPRVEKRNLGQRLIRGLKSAFGVPTNNPKLKDNVNFGGKRGGFIIEDDDDDISWNN